MNRDIRYQAWHKEEKKMYEVYAVGLEHVIVLSHTPTAEGMNSWKSLSQGIKAKHDLDFDYIVSLPREMVELREYAGLNDRTGRKIFDGDIVIKRSFRKSKNDYSDNKPAVVHWTPDKCGFN